MSPLHEIEQAIRHPGDFVSFPPLPGESASSHRTRLQAHATYKVFKAHNPVLPLPTEQISPRGITRQTNMTPDNPSSPEGQTKDILMLLQDMSKRLHKLEFGGTRRTRTGEVAPRKKLKGKKGVGGLVEALRQEKGWNQLALARRAGIAGSVISMMEKKDNPNPGIQTMVQIATAFGLSAGEFFSKLAEREKAPSE